LLYMYPARTRRNDHVEKIADIAVSWTLGYCYLRRYLFLSIL
jgi:hypothetical protein